MTSYPLTALCLLGLVGLVRGCSFPVGYEPGSWPLSKIFYHAPYVVIATGAERNDSTNTATYDVTCVMKSAEATYPARIYVHNVVNPHTCLNNPEYVLGTTYILTLRKVTEDYKEGYPQDLQFDNYEPDIGGVRNIYNATTSNLQTVYQTCGLTPTAVQGQTCPPGSPPPTGECEKPSGAPGVRNSAIGMLLAILTAAFAIKQ